VPLCTLLIAHDRVEIGPHADGSHLDVWRAPYRRSGNVMIGIIIYRQRKIMICGREILIAVTCKNLPGVGGTLGVLLRRSYTKTHSDNCCCEHRFGCPGTRGSGKISPEDAAKRQPQQQQYERLLLVAQSVSVQPGFIDLQVQLLDASPIARSARFIMLNEQIDKVILHLQQAVPVALGGPHTANSQKLVLYRTS
jgi:hypothetical protein